MSMIGSFIGALFMLPPRAKPGDPSASSGERDAQIVGLRIDLADARRDIEFLTEQADFWRREALRLRHDQPLPLGGQHAATSGGDWLQLGLAAQNALAQESQQALYQQACQNQHLAALAYPGGLGQNLLASQAWAQMTGQWASCTPSRPGALTGRQGDR